MVCGLLEAPRRLLSYLCFLGYSFVCGGGLCLLYAALRNKSQSDTGL